MYRTKRLLKFSRPYSAFNDTLVFPKGTPVRFSNGRFWISTDAVMRKYGSGAAHDSAHYGFEVSQEDTERIQ